MPCPGMHMENTQAFYDNNATPTATAKQKSQHAKYVQHAPMRDVQSTYASLGLNVRYVPSATQHTCVLTGSCQPVQNYLCVDISILT